MARRASVPIALSRLLLALSACLVSGLLHAGCVSYGKTTTLERVVWRADRGMLARDDKPAIVVVLKIREEFREEADATVGIHEGKGGEPKEVPGEEPHTDLFTVANAHEFGIK